MAAARFQVVSVARSVRLPVPREPGADAGSWVETPHPRVREFTWRFLAANNRSLARSSQAYPDTESCLAAICQLRECILEAAGEIFRNGHGQWAWRVLLDRDVVATGTRSYHRQVRAQLTCDAFLQLVAKTAAEAPVQVMYR